MKERPSISVPQYEDGPIRCQENLPILSYQNWQSDATEKRVNSAGAARCMTRIGALRGPGQTRVWRPGLAHYEVLGHSQVCPYAVDVFDISKLALPPHQGLNRLKQQSKVIARLFRRASGA
jgi:hypothetical protein